MKESRKSVEATETTVQQGHNIKLLTLVSIFFLPSQFVTSVFGMTNMPQSPSFWQFGVVLVAVCVPFFVLIGSLNSNRGMMFWQHRVEYVYAKLVTLFGWFSRRWAKKQKDEQECEKEEDEADARSVSTARPRLPRTDDSSFGEQDENGRQTAGRASDESPRHEGTESRAIKRASSSKLASMLKGEKKKGRAFTSEV